ncbi:MAG: CoA pyrophosphatase [Pseudomonadota bacterium]
MDPGDIEEPVTAAQGGVLTRDWIVARLALARGEGWLSGDDPQRMPAPEAGFTPAAVLVPLVQRSRGLQVLLTQRTAHLNDHAGQVSFPGGRVDPGDASREATALREAEEEIGLPRERIEVLGCLPEYHTVTGFSVTPVVGYVEPPFDLRLDAFEVADVFEVPLAFLMDPANHQRHAFVYQGRRRSYYAMPYEGRFIWGATAAMLLNLRRALYG